MARTPKSKALDRLQPKMRRLYVEEGESLQDIADRFDTYPNPIMNRLEDMGVERRGKSESTRMALRWDPEFTDDHISIIEGELLGDGFISKNEEGFVFGIQTTSKGHAVMLTERLPDEMFGDNQPWSRGPSEIGVNDRWILNSRRADRLDELRTRWYGEGGVGEGKDVPHDIELDWTMVYHWFIGDGCYNTTNRGNRVIFATDGFSAEGVAVLRRALSEFGCPSNIQTSEHVEDGSGQQIVVTGDHAVHLVESLGRLNDVDDYDYKFEVA